ITVMGPPPLIASLGGITVDTDPGQCSAVVADFALAHVSAANCEDAVIASSGIPPGNVFPVGSTPVTYTITDSFGRSSSCTVLVTVVDVEPPRFTNCPPAQTPAIAMCVPGGIGAVVNFTPPQATDACSIPTLSCDHAPGAVFP